MSQHDRWLADYRTHPTTVYCANKDCVNHQGMTATFFSEYGQSWVEPEDCPVCTGELQDNPQDEEE